MKQSISWKLTATCLLICLVFCMPACSSSPTEADELPDRPTIPTDIGDGMEYLYDFTFAERYDNQVTDDFSVTFPAGMLAGKENDTISLLERFQLQNEFVEEDTYGSDGMRPCDYKEYSLSNGSGKLYVKTDFYELDGVEYVNCIASDMDGVKTNQNVGVGSSDKEILTAYPENLYFLEQDDMQPAFAASDEFDYAYTWQPYHQDTNDIRDITFYMKEGRVAVMEMMEPFELRYVYGSELRKAQEVIAVN